MTQPRDLEPQLLQTATYYPVVAVTGPRQSGKTTLCRAAFPELPYLSLESLDARDFARSDPRGLLARYRDGAIFDEVQRVPELLSYLQDEVDRDPRPGRFILTGSHQLDLRAKVAQSLAGRVGLLELLPLTRSELCRFPHAPAELWATVWQGGYPRIAEVGIPASRWLADYVATYVERDVRQLLQIGDLAQFSTFLRLCAGRTAQELNLSKLGADVGVSHNTIRAWISVLEASFLIHRLPAWHDNVRKQAVRTAKLHFIDSGLCCHLLGIQSPAQLEVHSQRGAIFESWVVAEVLKARRNLALSPCLYHWREPRGAEVDLVVDDGASVAFVEVKSAATVASDWFAPLAAVAAQAAAGRGDGGVGRPLLVFGGDGGYERAGCAVTSWVDVGSAIVGAAGLDGDHAARSRNGAGGFGSGEDAPV